MGRDGPPHRAPERQRRSRQQQGRRFRSLRSPHQGAGPSAPARARRSRSRRDPLKDELAEEFRPIIGEVLAELKITLNRREQFALEKVLVDELLGLGPLEELLADPAISDIMVNGPDQTYVERKGKLEIAQIQFRDEEHLFQIAQRIVNKVGRRIDQTIAALRRPSPGRQPRQRHHPAAVAARHRHLDP